MADGGSCDADTPKSAPFGPGPAGLEGRLCDHAIRGRGIGVGVIAPAVVATVKAKPAIAINLIIFSSSFWREASFKLGVS